MKVPPVDNSGSTHTGKNEPSQADKVKKAEFEKVMKKEFVLCNGKSLRWPT